MKLLFDQNLSPRLPRILADIYPDSLHVREIGMREATDTAIWVTERNKVAQINAPTTMAGHGESVIRTADVSRSEFC